MTARSLLKVVYVAVWFTGSGMERLAFDPNPPTPVPEISVVIKR